MATYDATFGRRCCGAMAEPYKMVRLQVDLPYEVVRFLERKAAKRPHSSGDPSRPSDASDLIHQTICEAYQEAKGGKLPESAAEKRIWVNMLTPGCAPLQVSCEPPEDWEDASHWVEYVRAQDIREALGDG